MNTLITGSGVFIPPRVVGNQSFYGSLFYDEEGRKIDRDVVDVVRKLENITGIHERRYASDQYTNVDMAVKASSDALLDAGVDGEELDYIIVAHNFGVLNAGSFGKQGSIMPSVSAMVKHGLEISNTSTTPYDMIFGCPGWLEGVILAHKFIQSRSASKILVVGAEILSRVIDPHNRDSMIFSDGAGAVVLEAKPADEKCGVMATDTVSYNGCEFDYLAMGKSLKSDYLPESDVFLKMNGKKIYEFAVTHVPDVLKRVLDRASIALNQVSKVLFHQANEKMDKAILKKLMRLCKCDFSSEELEALMPITIKYYGNSSVATVPTMYHLVNSGKMASHKFSDGDYLVFGSVGAGINVNALVYKYRSA